MALLTDEDLFGSGSQTATLPPPVSPSNDSPAGAPRTLTDADLFGSPPPPTPEVPYAPSTIAQEHSPTDLLPADATENEARDWIHRRELLTGEPIHANELPDNPGVTAALRDERKKWDQISDETRKKFLKATRVEMQQAGQTPQQRILQDQYRSEHGGQVTPDVRTPADLVQQELQQGPQGDVSPQQVAAQTAQDAIDHGYSAGSPDARLADNPITRGVVSGGENLLSHVAETGLRLLPGAGAPSKLADKLARLRGEDSAQQEYINQQQGAAGYLQKATAMLTETIPVAMAGGLPAMVIQAGANGAANAYAEHPEKGDAYALGAGAIDGAMMLVGGKVAGTTASMLAGEGGLELGGATAGQAAKKLMGAYLSDQSVQAGQYVASRLWEKANGIRPDADWKTELEQQAIVSSIAWVAATAGHATEGQPEAKPGLADKVREFLAKPTEETAKAAGLEEAAPDQASREKIAQDAAVEAANIKRTESGPKADRKRTGPLSADQPAAEQPPLPATEQPPATKDALTIDQSAPDNEPAATPYRQPSVEDVVAFARSAPEPPRVPSVDDIASLAREPSIRSPRDLLTGDQLRQQFHATATSPEEADALFGLVAARAEASGQSLDDYVGQRFHGVEKANLAETLAGRGTPQAEGRIRRGEVEFAEDGRAIIRAFDAQSVATLAHEVGHVFRRDLSGEDLRIAGNWAGARGETWDRPAEEKFARGFERYLLEGRAPTPRLGKIFEQFKGWLTSVYTRLKGSPIDLNIPEDMKGVYDRLFQSDDSTPEPTATTLGDAQPLPAQQPTSTEAVAAVPTQPPGPEAVGEQSSDRPAASGEQSSDRAAILPSPAMILPLDKFSEAASQAWDQLLKLTAPHMRGGGAKETAKDVYALGGKLARARDQFEAATKEARNYFERRPAAENIDRIQRAQTGKLDASDKADKFMLDVQERQKALLSEFERVKPGITAGWQEYYWRQQWQDPSAAQRFWDTWNSKRPIAGKKSILRQRKYPTIQDGIAAGLKPLSTNPIDFAEDAYVQSVKYIQSEDLKTNLKAAGRIGFSANYRDAPDGWTKINDPLFEVWSKGENDERILRGHYYAPDEVATIVNNYLSRPLESYSKAFGLVNKASHLQTTLQLGISAFHVTMTGLQSVESAMAQGFRDIGQGRVGAAGANLLKSAAAPFEDVYRGTQVQKAWIDPKLSTPEARIVADVYEKAGGRAMADKKFTQQFTKAFKEGISEGDVGKQLRNAPFAVLEQAARPIMEKLVPAIKAGAFYRTVQGELERNPGMTPEQLRDFAVETQKSMDNRFGQVVQDNTLTHGVVRSLQNFSLRAFQYAAGTLREHGGAVADTASQVGSLIRGKPKALTNKQAYVGAEVVVAGVAGMLTQYALTGKKPENAKDLFFPQDGGVDRDGNPTRLRIPGYLNDLVAYAHDPATALEHKLNPVIGEIAQLIHNRDYFGEQIYGAGGQGVGSYLEKQAMPFSFQNIAKMRQRGEGVPAQVAAAAGIGPAPGYISQTPAQKMMQDISIAGMDQGPRTADQVARTQLRRQVIDRMRTGKPIDDLNAGSQFDAADLKKMKAEASEKPFTTSFLKLTPAQSAQVYHVATPAEQAEGGPLLLKKFLGMHGGADSDASARALVKAEVDGNWSQIEGNLGDDAKPAILKAVDAAVLRMQRPERKDYPELADYQSRLADYNSWQGDLSLWLKSHRDSPIIQDALDSLQKSKQWRDSMKVTALRARRVGETKAEYETYREDRAWHIERKGLAQETLQEFARPR